MVTYHQNPWGTAGALDLLEYNLEQKSKIKLNLS